MYKVTLALNYRQLFSTKKKGMKLEFTQKPIKTTGKANSAVESTNKEKMKEGSTQKPEETTEKANGLFWRIRKGIVDEFTRKPIKTTARVIAAFAGFGAVVYGGEKIVIYFTKTPEKKENQGSNQSIDRTASPLNQPAQVGNIAEGLAWSHYMGYTRIVLRELVAKIQESQLYKDHKKCFPLKEFNIFPLSAKSMTRLTEFNLPTEYRFNPEDPKTIVPIKADHGSFKGREHEVTVYSILDPKTAQRYYFVAHIPNSLTILGKLEEKGLINKNDRKTEDIPRIVFVDYTKCIPEDNEVAKKLKDHLQQRKYKVLNKDPGINETKCMVLVVSKRSLKEREQKNARKQDLHQRLQNNATLIVVLTDDLTEEELTVELQIRPHTILRFNDENNFWKSLLQEITHGHRDSDIPDTAKTGLAYAYVYNYLETNLKDADERMKRLHSQSKESKLYKKLLIIVPKLFVKNKLRVLETNEKGQKIAGFEDLKPDFKEEIVSGMESRKYQLIPYKVEEKTNPLIKCIWRMFGWQKEYLIMAEYPNPVICLQSIQVVALAHWTEEKLEGEVNGFIELTKQLIEKSDVVRGKAHVLYIDDKDNVKDAVVKFLKEQDKENPTDFKVFQDPATKSTKS